MNKDEWRKALPVIEGFIEGKPVQYFDPLAGRWFDTKNIDEMDKFIYRIKPKPKSLWLYSTDISEWEGRMTIRAFSGARPPTEVYVKYQEIQE